MLMVSSVTSDALWRIEISFNTQFGAVQ